MQTACEMAMHEPIEQHQHLKPNMPTKPDIMIMIIGYGGRGGGGGAQRRVVNNSAGRMFLRPFATSTPHAALLARLVPCCAHGGLY